MTIEHSFPRLGHLLSHLPFPKISLKNNGDKGIIIKNVCSQHCSSIVLERIKFRKFTCYPSCLLRGKIAHPHSSPLPSIFFIILLFGNNRLSENSLTTTRTRDSYSSPFPPAFLWRILIKSSHSNPACNIGIALIVWVLFSSLDPSP